MNKQRLDEHTGKQATTRSNNTDGHTAGRNEVIKSGLSNHSTEADLPTAAQVAAMIDHTLLKPEATQAQVIQLCEEAIEHRFATVCINPCWVSTAAGKLRGTTVGVTTVIGFPLGATSTFAKIAEARDAIASGATEIDMVINIGALKSGLYDLTEKDIAGVVQACKDHAVLKVIIETGHLTEEEKIKACEMAQRAGADFVKTSTGFGPGHATAEDVQLMRNTVGAGMGVKASAGVRDLDTARRMIRAGANRLGTSSGMAIMQGQAGKGY